MISYYLHPQTVLPKLMPMQKMPYLHIKKENARLTTDKNRINFGVITCLTISATFTIKILNSTITKRPSSQLTNLKRKKITENRLPCLALLTVILPSDTPFELRNSSLTWDRRLHDFLFSTRNSLLSKYFCNSVQNCK